jgi:hypothetical protein
MNLLKFKTSYITEWSEYMRSAIYLGTLVNRKRSTYKLHFEATSVLFSASPWIDSLVYTIQ